MDILNTISLESNSCLKMNFNGGNHRHDISNSRTDSEIISAEGSCSFYSFRSINCGVSLDFNMIYN